MAPSRRPAPASVRTFGDSLLLTLLSPVESCAAPPMNVSAYRAPRRAASTAWSGLNAVVEKKTMSPATAGNDDTFSSSPEPSTLARSIWNVFAPVDP